MDIQGNLSVDGDEVFSDLTNTVQSHNTPAAARQYEADVMQIVNGQIRTVLTGVRLLRLIGDSPNRIGIVPNVRTENAAAHPVQIRTATPRGAPIRNNFGQPAVQGAPGRPLPPAALGLGGGSKVLVMFNPATRVPNLTPDVTLLHELLHSYRQSRGRWRLLPMLGVLRLTAPDIRTISFATFEEWLGVLVENIYSSERGRTVFRAAHVAPGALGSVNDMSFRPDAISGRVRDLSAEWASQYALAIDHLRNDDRALFYALANSRARFNPLRNRVIATQPGT